ncbi:MAG: hypothetical protein E6R03_11565 [Hyphomicrobiaceae bacterium]|nr:MAG: hypothetical protein E6R03_11565 [Hyphomicrobiaceae bacterium]
MSTPITWRNVTGPSLADAAKPLAYAQSAFSGGFDALSNALKGFQGEQEKIWKQEDAQATQDVLSKIYAADSLDKFNALKSTGVLDQAIAANGARIDRAAVNALLDGRVGTLQTRDKDNAAYALDLNTREQAPIFRQIQALAISNPPAARELLNQNPGLIKEFELSKLIDEQGQLLKERTYKADEEDFKKQKRPVELQELRSSIAANDSTRALNNAQKTLAMQQSLANNITKLDNAITSAQETWNSAAGQKSINETLNSFKDPADREYASQMLKVIESDPKYNSLTAPQVVQAINANMREGWWDKKWFGGQQDDFRKTIDSMLPQAISLAKDRETLLSNLRTQQAVANAQYNQFMGIPMPTAAPAPAESPTAPPVTAAPGAPARPTAASLGMSYQPLPGTPQELANRALVAQLDKVAEQQKVVDSAKPAEQAKEARRQEISWLTTNEVAVLKPSEAQDILSKYQDVLPGGANGRLARALRQRL